MDNRSELMSFTNERFGSIRTFEEDGNVWFCAIDVTNALEYKNSSSAVLRHCKSAGITKRDVSVMATNQHGGTNKKLVSFTFINESNLYRLITHSKLPAAEQFEKWIFEDVLPTIRKHGMYVTEDLLNNPDLLIQVAQRYKEEKQKNEVLIIQLDEKNKLIEDWKPKVSYYDLILQNPSLILTTEIAKDYGMSAIQFNRLLHQEGIQYKVNQWVLYQKYADKGYTQSQTVNLQSGRVVTQMCWTQKGRLFLYNYLKDHCDLVPVIEREPDG